MNLTPVRTEVDVWLTILVEDLIVNVHWDSEGLLVKVGMGYFEKDLRSLLV